LKTKIEFSCGIEAYIDAAPICPPEKMLKLWPSYGSLCSGTPRSEMDWEQFVVEGILLYNKAIELDRESFFVTQRGLGQVLVIVLNKQDAQKKSP